MNGIPLIHSLLKNYLVKIALVNNNIISIINTLINFENVLRVNLLLVTKFEIYSKLFYVNNINIKFVM